MSIIGKSEKLPSERDLAEQFQIVIDVHELSLSWLRKVLELSRKWDFVSSTRVQKNAWDNQFYECQVSGKRSSF